MINACGDTRGRGHMWEDYKPLLELNSISKGFGGLIALRDISLCVRQGEICGVIGPNGAGKSTLFSIIAGSLPPTSGRLLFGATDVTGMPMHRRARLGIVRTFQWADTFESMTVEENIIVGAENHARLALFEAITHLGSFQVSLADAKQRTHNAMDVVGVAALAETHASQLTFGQQRLVATARALAANPRLLLLDEPAAGLSSGDIEALVRALRRARSDGATILIVEHNMDVIMQLCDHIIVMHLGEKIGDGTPDAVRQSERVVEAYLGA